MRNIKIQHSVLFFLGGCRSFNSGAASFLAMSVTADRAVRLRPEALGLPHGTLLKIVCAPFKCRKKAGHVSDPTDVYSVTEAVRAVVAPFAVTFLVYIVE